MNTIKAIETRYAGYRFRSKSGPPTPLGKRISKRANHAGKRFGRLTVVELLGNTSSGYKWWGCVCDCGERVAVRSRELTDGDTRSCGCLQREYQSRAGGRNILPFGEASKNELLASYIKSATSRNHEWGLSREKFDELIDGECVYCGVSKNKERKPNKGVNGGFFYTGIDRIDSGKGYVPGNVVSCCWDCNRAKGALSDAEFREWISRLMRHQTEHGERP